VTRFNFEEGFRWLQQVMTSDDVGVIYFAGQVLRDQHDSLYFQHQESRFGDPAAGMSDHTLKGYLKKIPGKLFLVMDLIARDENSQTAVNPTLPPSYERRFVTDLVRELAEEDYGVAVLAAIGSSEPSASATAPNRSAFVQALLDSASAKADTNANKVIDVTELIAVVRKDLSQRLPSTTVLTAAMPTLIKAFPIVSVP
jgi:hypothetical protein